MGKKRKDGDAPGIGAAGAAIGKGLGILARLGVVPGDTAERITTMLGRLTQGHALGAGLAMQEAHKLVLDCLALRGSPLVAHCDVLLSVHPVGGGKFAPDPNSAVMVVQITPREATLVRDLFEDLNEVSARVAVMHDVANIVRRRWPTHGTIEPRGEVAP